MRFIISFVLAFAVSAALGRVLIPWLRALKAGQSIIFVMLYLHIVVEKPMAPNTRANR